MVKRLRSVRLDAERERHIFNMIRISERAWAGLLEDVDAAQADIEGADEYCRKHGV
jgi:hypothetical protein